MLKRQKILLNILKEADRPVSHIELVKAAFLLRHESTLANEPAFYDFVPYRFGPFSFALYRELSTLVRDGYVIDTEKSIRLAERMKSEAREQTAELPSAWRRAVTRTVAEAIILSGTEAGPTLGRQNRQSRTSTQGAVHVQVRLRSR